jgi:hypothetical protein
VMLLMCLSWGCALSRHRVKPRAGELDEITKPLPNGSAILAIRPYSRILMSRSSEAPKEISLSDHLVQIYLLANRPALQT